MCWVCFIFPKIALLCRSGPILGAKVHLELVPTVNKDVRSGSVITTNITNRLLTLLTHDHELLIDSTDPVVTNITNELLTPLTDEYKRLTDLTDSPLQASQTTY